MVKTKTKKRMNQFLVIVTLLLFFNLPFITAINISEVNADSITSSSAVITWNTDEESNTFVSYGTDQNNLNLVGDSNDVNQHNFLIDNLEPDSNYYYKVESNGEEDNNDGAFYDFKTLAPDTTAPELIVELSESIAGTNLEFSGWTEIGATVKVYVDDAYAGSTVARAVEIAETTNGTEGTEVETSKESLSGRFTFSGIGIEPNKKNIIKVETIDASGNIGTWQGSVSSDASKPRITLDQLPEISGETTLQIKGNISEEANYEIFVNDKSVATKEATLTIEESIGLSEGSNEIKFVVKDNSGWETIETYEVLSDTRAPGVQFKIEKGTEYYQGRAVSSVNGETEPNANVYLYVYRPIGYEYNPKFDKAWKKVTADQNGSFTFKDVDFEDEPISLESLSPKDVPSGLLEYSILPVQSVEAQQSWTYNVFVIAEDVTGKNGYQHAIINVNTCYSATNDFDVMSIAAYQAPLRLDPKLLDEGREMVSGVFNFTYRGSGSPKKDLATGKVVEAGYKITSVHFDRACTQAMMKDNSTKLGCNILPPTPQKTSNADKSAWYITYGLQSADKLSEKENSFWDEFQKRQVKFPLKIRINYQERQADGKWSDIKTQTSCYDLGYFVDIPLDSKEYIPDWLADEGVKSVNYTVHKIDMVLPYLEKAILVTGVSCITSFLSRMATRWARIFTSKMEAYTTRTNEPAKRCPLPSKQNQYYLKSTIEHWKKVESNFAAENKVRAKDWDKKILDDVCPQTANLWKVEAVLDQAYKWTCDRVFCRAVPAGWTSTKDKKEVDAVADAQSSCSVSSKGIPLQKIENCEKQVKQNVANVNSLAASLVKNGSFTCYRYNDNLYVIDSNQKQSDLGQMIKLKKVHSIGLTLDVKSNLLTSTDLIAYKPAGSDQFIVGQDTSCKTLCKNPRKTGYVYDKENSVTNLGNPDSPKSDQYGCYAQYKDESGKLIVKDKNNQPLKSTGYYQAGFTTDCFVDFTKTGDDNNPKGYDSKTGATGLLECVCKVDEKASSKTYGARTAMKEVKGTTEDWIYRQSAIFTATKGSSGTYYPEWRYYTGRDFSSAFGADYLLDYARTTPKVTKVNPNTQHVGAFQTLCLSGVRARLVMLKSVLQGLQNCITEAKYTGLNDAGVCKTVFSQHVCGLMYKSIAYFFTDCSPTSFSDKLKESSLPGVSTFFSAGFGSIGTAMQSSINDIKADYGNAKLNEYFATGSQGFAQSMCMAAFGFDWPMGMDFIKDAAYATPMKSTVHVIPAERELATYNPSKGTTVYNYNVGAMVLPGCKIKSYNAYLKCIGPEDQGHKGIDCGPQGCDCLHATQVSSIEGEKIRSLDGGRGFDLKQGSFVSLPIKAPQKIDSHYRYDHVVVELMLDPNEKADNCFDDGYKDGKFYFPITDTSSPGTATCQVDLTTGRYICPEITSMFGGSSGAYIEDPYMTCYDSNTATWASCDTPNLFTKGKEIRLKSHIMTNGEPYCLKVTTSGLPQGIVSELPQQLPKGIQGPFAPTINLGTVSETLFAAGGSESVKLSTQSSDPGCSNLIQYSTMGSGTTSSSGTFRFNYQKSGDKYNVQIPAGVTVDLPYTKDTNGYLSKDGNRDLTSDDLKAAKFNIGGSKVYGLIGAPQVGTNNACVYELSSTSSRFTGTSGAFNQRSISVTTQLLHPDASGSCVSANVPVKAAAFGKASHTQTIVLQMEPVVKQVTSKMHEEFMKSNYNYVKQSAESIINRKKSDLEDAIANYYLVSTYIMLGGSEWKTKYNGEICNLLTLFVNRESKVLGEKYDDYPKEIIVKEEYKKIYKYLMQVNSKLPSCTDPKWNIELTGSSDITGTLCASKFGLKESFIQPTNWNTFSCKAGYSDQTKCYSYKDYVPENKQSSPTVFGCPGDQLCCPQ